MKSARQDPVAMIAGVDIVIRAAQPNDLSALVRLYHERNPEDPQLSADTARAAWEAIRAQAGRAVLVAAVDSDLVGSMDCLVVPNLTRNARPILFIENVIVAAAYRRRGIASRLLEAAIGIARSRDCYKAQLLSAAGPEAHAFYEAHEFHASARGYRRYF
jgi:GNAT superfamily N-acetyltransferase